MRLLELRDGVLGLAELVEVDAEAEVRQAAHVLPRLLGNALEAGCRVHELGVVALRDPVADHVEVGLVHRRLARVAVAADGVDRIVGAHDAAVLGDPEGGGDVLRVEQLGHDVLAVEE